MSLLSEFKRRNVPRAMAADVAGAWLLTEFTGRVSDVYGPRKPVREGPDFSKLMADLESESRPLSIH